MRGRRPTPTTLKLVRGNPGKRKVNAREPQPASKRIPAPPAHLLPEGQAEWKRLTKVLPAGLVTTLDRGIFTAYCDAFGRWAHAHKELAKHGNQWVIETAIGNLMQNPWLSIANSALEQLRKAAAELGLTPSARSRVAIGETEKPAGKAAKFFARRA